MVLGLAVTGSAVKGEDTFAVDPYHSSISFMIQHLGISYVHGRFNEMSGSFMIDKEDPAKSSFALSIKVDSVDTAVKKRDDHLRSPDFFNSKQFPAITFQSTDAKAVKAGHEITGDFTMHGVTKAITFTLKGGKTAEQKGTTRIGFYGNLSVSRKDFGIVTAPDMLGDEVHIYLGLEAVKK
jgi:polyisoprenoid-binding protein YceI